LKSKKGKWLDWDNYYGAQCVDLARHYTNYLGYPQHPPVGGAKEMWSSRWSKDFTKAKTPRRGDLAIFGGGRYGHVSVVESLTPGGFLSLDQNWVNFDIETGSKAAWVNHKTKDVLGFIRPNLEGIEVYKGHTAKYHHDKAAWRLKKIGELQVALKKAKNKPPVEVIKEVEKIVEKIVTVEKLPSWYVENVPSFLRTFISWFKPGKGNKDV